MGRKKEVIIFPDYVEKLKNRHFIFKGDDCYIAMRKKELKKKPPLYIFNLSKSCYVSSLIPINEKTFYFDQRTATDLLKYNLLVLENGDLITKAI